jgi:hypothetical protein
MVESTKLGRLGAKEIVKGVLPQLVHLRIGSWRMIQASTSLEMRV